MVGAFLGIFHSLHRVRPSMFYVDNGYTSGYLEMPLSIPIPSDV